MSELLTAREEALLKEILEHRLPNGHSDSSYWEKRFNDPALTHDSETMLRGTFGKLKKKGMIKTMWADDFPYLIDVLDDGLTYFEDKGAADTMAEKPTIFVSYQQKSGSAFVDDLERVLADKATVVRDKNLGAWNSLDQFMKSIRDQDFAVLVITDEYLKSVPCMTEVTQFMREKDWSDRVMFAVLDSSVYSRKAEYFRFWEERQRNLDEQRKGDSVGLTELESITNEMKQIQKFSAELNDFFSVLYDRKNPQVWMILIEIMNRIDKIPASAPESNIPEVFHQLTADAKAKRSMSIDAADLLRNAAKKGQQIILIQDLSGWLIGLNGDSDTRVTEPRRVAELREAIEQLEQLGFIEAADTKRQIFSVTAEGYRIADRIEIDALLE